MSKQQISARSRREPPICRTWACLAAVSTAEHSLIKRATSLEVQLELIELSWLEAGQATADSLDLFSRVAGNLRRLLTEIGYCNAELKTLHRSLLIWLRQP